MDVETLLQNVSAELPCGEDIERDAEFGELERAVKGKPEQSIGDTTISAEEPDWADVETRANQLLSRTKDLRIAVYLARAQLHTNGFVGFADALGLIRGLVEKYWDTIYPWLDPEDSEDPRMRLNAIDALRHADTMLRGIRETTLATAPRLHTKVSYRDIAIANGTLKITNGSQEPDIDLAGINATFMDCNPEALQSCTEAVAAAKEHALAIEQHITDQVGPSDAPNLNDLHTLLGQIQKILAEKSEARGMGAAETVDNDAMPDGDSATGTDTVGTDPAGQAAGSLSGQIRNRNDVVRSLDMICAYYERNEPSSPVPLLMRRAKGLVAKDFMAILSDLVPDGLSQAESIRGQTTDDSGDSEE